MLILKNSQTSFVALKSILSQAIESVRDVGGVTEAASLEVMVNNIERDVDEWCHLNHLGLTLLIEEQLNHLTEQVQKTYSKMSQEAEAVS